MSCAALEAFREKYDVEAVSCAGLSLGEYGALYAAGAFSFADGLKLLNKRAELMDVCCKNTSGGMASVLGGDPAIIKETAAECDIDVANSTSASSSKLRRGCVGLGSISFMSTSVISAIGVDCCVGRVVPKSASRPLPSPLFFCVVIFFVLVVISSCCA